MVFQGMTISNVTLQAIVTMVNRTYMNSVQSTYIGNTHCQVMLIVLGFYHAGEWDFIPQRVIAFFIKCVSTHQSTNLHESIM